MATKAIDVGQLCWALAKATGEVELVQLLAGVAVEPIGSVANTKTRHEELAVG